MEESGGGVPSPAVAPGTNGEVVGAAAVEKMEQKNTATQGGDVAEATKEEKVVASAAGERNGGQGGGAVAVEVSGVVGGAGATGFGVASVGVRKKRGRPRKYAPDGSLARPLNPRPLSASVPVGEYTPATAVGAVMKLGRGWPEGVGFREAPQIAFQVESSGTVQGEMVACSAGANFTPHILTVACGEDITMKIISFSQQGPKAICILSANGVVSNVTLRQPDSFGGTLTYEGRFQLLSLSGSFIPSENGGTRSRSGGMSVSLASADGRVIGGGVAGLLVAASPVQVVVGSFFPSYHLEQKVQNSKVEIVSQPLPMPTISFSNKEVEGCDPKAHSSPKTSKSNPTTLSFSSFKLENWPAPLQSVPDTRNSVVA
ncbi:AT-hook motif nuclear-localized protein 7-like [Curcuma longa]|uniref:AT-hook motif nuclear-localized protein 7-like n=1 Tax=Curcuma longa TaxID=136217 RepID=UPI003D9F2FBF